MPKIKNILIFVAIGAVLVFGYVYFIKKPADTAPLISSSGNTVSTGTPKTAETSKAVDNSAVAKEFLSLLLSVKNIKLNDDIFSDNAFISLHDSSITLIPDGNEGRVNPFAPLGIDDVTLPTSPN